MSQPVADGREALAAYYAARYHSSLPHRKMDEVQTARELSVPVRITPTCLRAW